MKFLILGSLFLVGCVYSPVDERPLLSERETIQTSMDPDLKKPYIDDSEYKRLYKASPNTPYNVRAIERGNWKFGNWEFLLDHDYEHEITIGFYCGENEDFISQSKMANKNLKWKVSEKIKGDSITDGDGYVNIFFYDKEQSNYPEVKITYNEEVYTVRLPAYARVKLKNCS